MAFQWSRKLGIALAGSVALNLFAIGLGVGLWLDDTVRGRAVADLGVAETSVSRIEIGEPLPDMVRAQVSQVLASERRAVAGHLVILQRARDGVAAALTEDPYDPSAAEAAFAELRARTEALRTDLHDALIVAAGSLSPTERRDLAATLFLTEPPDGRSFVAELPLQ